MSDAKVINGHFPNAKLRKLYDQLCDILDDDDFGSLSCAEVVGALEMIKMEYVINSMQEDE